MRKATRTALLLLTAAVLVGVAAHSETEPSTPVSSPAVLAAAQPVESVRSAAMDVLKSIQVTSAR